MDKTEHDGCILIYYRHHPMIQIKESCIQEELAVDDDTATAGSTLLNNICCMKLKFTLIG